MNYNKLCELADFADEDLAELIREVSSYKVRHFENFPAGAEHRKDWEVAMAVRTLRDFDALRPDATILGVAAGLEDALFYLTRHVKQVFATDRYLSSGAWDHVAPLSMLVDPALVAPYDFDPSRLVVQHMDGRVLRYPDNTFDGIFSSGSIEHFGMWPDVASAAYEMGRVLKPGGVLTLSTEFLLGGPPGGHGWPNVTLLFSPEELRRYIIDASGLELIDEPELELSDATLQTRRDMVSAVADHHARVAGKGGDDYDAEFAEWDFPHLVMAYDGFVFGSVHLALRKPESYPVIDNAWARPSEQIIASIREFNESVVNRRPEPEASPLQPAAEAAPAADSRPPWVQRMEGLAASAAQVSAARDRVVDLVNHFHEFRNRHAGMGSQFDEQQRQIDAALVKLAALEPGLAAASERANGSAGPGIDTSGWPTVLIPVPGGRYFHMVLEPDTADPIGQVYASGYGLFFQNLAELMLDIIGPGDGVLDLGAHIGTFALTAAAADSWVIAVEAGPMNAALLRASVVRNSFHNLRVIEAAVSDSAGTLEFVAAGPWGHVTSRTDEGPVIKVPAIPTDELVEQIGFPGIKFVKMDVEGWELKAIDGMKRLLSGPKAPYVLYECNAHTLASLGLSPDDLHRKIFEFGYRSFLVDELNPRRLFQVREGELQPQTSIDCLAVPPGAEPPASWTVEPSMPTSERIVRLNAESKQTLPEARAWVARALESADRAVLDHPLIAEVMGRLSSDTSDEVRSAAAWWSPPSATGFSANVRSLQ
jgi:FkbM family methyltransferase